jgi:hypothetical protein
MKPNQLKNFVLLALFIAAIAGCKQKTDTAFELKGTLKGITDGKIVMYNPQNDTIPADTVSIKEGSFVFTKDIPEPTMYFLQIVGKDDTKMFYAENAKMLLTGQADSLRKAIIKGGATNEADIKFNAGSDLIRKKFGLDTLNREYARGEVSDKRQQEILALVAKFKIENEQLMMQFVKENPASYYSAVLVARLSYGLSATEIDQALKILDPKLNDYTIVADMYKMVDNLKATDVSVDKFVNNAQDANYSVDNIYPGKVFTGMKYLASFPDDNICTLCDDGTVYLIDPKGIKLSEFKSSLKAKPSAMAINATNSEIYLLGTTYVQKESKYRGKTYKSDEPVGVECKVYDKKGVELKKMDLPELKTVTGAKIINNKLIVADYQNRSVIVYNLETGKKEASLADLRTCCGILDFGINSKNEILVANLGAFRVQAFDYKGKIKYAFGKRGRTIDDFHGCCNPVNVAYLNNGAIITVEKDPTRIKVYTKSGAKQVDGIQELVKGCRYIPMTSDSKNNIYLASAKSGIVKCSPVK